MVIKYLGLILPDILALALLWLEFRWFDVVRRGSLRNLPDLSAERRWEIENSLASDLNAKFFAGTFFIPGLVSLVSYLGLLLENGLHERSLVVLLVAVVLWVVDIWHCARHFDRPTGAAWHKKITLAFIFFIMAVKIAVKAGYL